MNDKLACVRRQYGQLSLDQTEISQSPFDLFSLWLDEYLESENVQEVPMVLSTVDTLGHPDSRVVLLREFTQQQLIFYTNYHSCKGKQIEQVPYVALNFYWYALSRQVRIKGMIEKISAEKSDQYFNSRPMQNQIGSIVSNQSEVISSRDELDQKINAMLAQDFPKITRPEHWGGYAVMPTEIEFWQGRDDRMSDRIQYLLQQNGKWLSQRLAP